MTLASFATSLRPPPEDTASTAAQLPADWQIADDFREFLDADGHGFTTDDAFHFFGRSSFVEHDLLKWNEPAFWRGAFPNIGERWLAFAEDVFGNQFFIRADGKVRHIKALMIWIGSFTIAAGSFSEFVNDVILDPEIWQPLRNRFAELRPTVGAKPFSFVHLAHKIPLTLGGRNTPENYEWTNAAANMSILAQLRMQL